MNISVSRKADAILISVCMTSLFLNFNSIILIVLFNLKVSDMLKCLTLQYNLHFY